MKTVRMEETCVFIRKVITAWKWATMSETWAYNYWDEFEQIIAIYE